MAKVHGSWIKEILDKTKIDERGIFKAYVIYGIENFNLKKIYRASVSSGFSGVTGVFFDNFKEAEEDAKRLLLEECESFEKELVKYENH